MLRRQRQHPGTVGHVAELIRVVMLAGNEDHARIADIKREGLWSSAYIGERRNEVAFRVLMINIYAYNGTSAKYDCP